MREGTVAKEICYTPFNWFLLQALELLTRPGLAGARCSQG